MPEPPYEFWPHRRVVNVGWGGVAIIVIIASYENKSSLPAFGITDLPITGVMSDVFSSTSVDNRNPFDTAMLQTLQMWSRTPKLIAGTNETPFQGTAIDFINAGKVHPPFSFKIHTPAASGEHIITGVTYWVWDKSINATLDEALAHPHTTGVILGGVSGIVTIPIGFNDSAGASNFGAQMLASFIVGIEARTSTVTVLDFLKWSIQVVSYKRKLDYPSRITGLGQLVPDWNVSGDPNKVGDAADFAQGNVVASATLKVSVAQDLGITLERV